MPISAPRPLERAALLDALASESFDTLVVGGGITGCGIARDAALRGLRVALVEKDDFASGTSSRSSRLVHGGVRYLEHGHLHLVFEASAERRRLLKLAPHLVRPLEFLWPVYERARIPRWKLAAGLALYDVLALFRNVARHRTLDPRAILEREPRLRPEGLRGGARYYDAATDDARLTLANAIGALEAGAVVANHVAMRGVERAGEAVAGARVTDMLTGLEAVVRARTIVNAAGPWSDQVRAMTEADGRRAPAVRGSKGVHVAVPKERIGNRGALTLLSPRDGRVMFMLPAGPLTMIGTTDTYTTSDPDEVRATDEDVHYLLEAANDFFPAARLEPDDVVAAWAGIRPLIARSTGGLPGAASREHAVTSDAAGVVTVTGGKLTTYRVMADDVMRAVSTALGRDAGVSPTRNAVLPGGDLPTVGVAIDEARAAVGDDVVAEHLVRSHGSRWRAVADEFAADPGARERLEPELPYTVGELRHAVRRELACTVADLLMRRTHLAFETRDHGLGIAPKAAAVLAGILGLDETARAEQVTRYRAEVERVFRIDAVPASLRP